MSDRHHTLHTTEIDAPARVVHDIIADVSRWPVFFTPNIHVEHVERGERTERIRIWATAGGEVKQWTSRRDLDPEALTVRFRQEVSTHPVASMGGTWRAAALSPARTRLELHHDFTVVDDAPEHVAWVNAALDGNSDAELAGIKRVAERYDELDALMFSFEDTVRIEGDARDVFDFLNRADLWPQRLPHVSRLELTEDQPGVQVMAMDTKAADGSVHTTESVRVVRGGDRIVYKQTTVPALMSAHTGCWTLTPRAGGVDATSQHTVVVKPEAVERVLGAGRTVADARNYVRNALSTNSRATLGHAKAYAEARRGG
ncbi:aromatase/cyclase [Streptomyces sp. NPDC056580]|uniref:aromatase/cyclase n=1 Tax=Streptomyces sp. NPDC056580 TaxID=3345872 RepID=UPI0036BEF929